MAETLKIGLAGCAGLGKSTVAAKLSGVLGIPFLASKDITRPALEEYGYDYRACVEKFLSRKEIEYEMVARRIEAEERLDSFVTDRTVLECFAYSILSMDTYAGDEWGLLGDACREHFKTYTHVFLFPAASGWLVDNGIRTVDRRFQRMIDILIRGAASQWGAELREIPDGVEPCGFIMQELEKG